MVSQVIAPRQWVVLPVVYCAFWCIFFLAYILFNNYYFTGTVLIFRCEVARMPQMAAAMEDHIYLGGPLAIR